MRTAKPWYRSANDTWYVCHRGQQIPLAKGKRSKRNAEAAFHRLMADFQADAASGPNPAAATIVPTHALLVAELLDHFLDWVKLNLDCYDWHRHFLQKFAEGCGRLTVAEIKPIHVTTWLAKKPTWGTQTRTTILVHLPTAR